MHLEGIPIGQLKRDGGESVREARSEAERHQSESNVNEIRTRPERSAKNNSMKQTAKFFAQENHPHSDNDTRKSDPAFSRIISDINALLRKIRDYAREKYSESDNVNVILQRDKESENKTKDVWKLSVEDSLVTRKNLDYRGAPFKRVADHICNHLEKVPLETHVFSRKPDYDASKTLRKIEFCISLGPQTPSAGLSPSQSPPTRHSELEASDKGLKVRKIQAKLKEVLKQQEAERDDLTKRQQAERDDLSKRQQADREEQKKQQQAAREKVFTKLGEVTKEFEESVQSLAKDLEDKEESWESKKVHYRFTIEALKNDNKRLREDNERIRDAQDKLTEKCERLWDQERT